MPVAYVDIPAGVNDGAKKKIFQELYEEIHQAWPTRADDKPIAAPANCQLCNTNYIVQLSHISHVEPVIDRDDELLSLLCQFVGCHLAS